MSDLKVNKVSLPLIDSLQDEPDSELKIPSVPLKEVNSIEDEPDKKYIVPLDGRWIIGEEPAIIGKNFVNLINMRYAGAHPEGVMGMTKINTSIMNATYYKARSAFHFNKATPAESHVLVQAYNTGKTASQLLDNTTAIPSAGAFSATALWTDSAGASVAQFSDAPNGQMTYCNKVDSLIWAGSEGRCAAFITSTAAITDTGTATDPKDYTDLINTTKQTETAIIGGGNDSYTVLLLHGEGTDASTTITDSSIGGGGAPPKTVTASGNAAIDTAQAKFGSGSIILDGTTDFVYVDSTDADINDFYMGTGTFTIDFWARFNSVAADQPFFEQRTADDHIVYCYWDQGTKTIIFTITDTASAVTMSSSAWTPVVGTWYHISIVRGWALNGNKWEIAVNGVGLGTVTDTDAWPDLDADFVIGGSVLLTAYFNGWIDEFRVSKGIARWTADFTPPSRSYTTTSRVWLIGSTRPLKGIKYYISAGNSIASTMTGKEWNGNTWSAITLTDGTDTGATLATTGTVSFATTVGTAQPKYLEGYFLYWYQFVIDAGEAEIYYVTVDMPPQNIVDIWDGNFRRVGKFFRRTTVYSDDTSKVYSEDYVSGSASTYSDIDELIAFSDPDYCLEIGFTEKQTALMISMVSGFCNAIAATTATVDYWNGEEYVSVGTITDGTSEGAISLAKTGVISWNNNSLAGETKKSVSNSIPLYFYRLRFDKGFAPCYIDFVGGIPAARTLSGYSFGIHAADRLMLGCDNYGKKNLLNISPQNKPDMFNGTDHFEIEFGDDKALTCGTSIFAQYASSIYNIAIILKASEMWTLVWSEGSNGIQWERYRVSPNVGCPAPLTLKTVSCAFENNINQVKAIAIWRADDGIYVSNGQSPLKVSGDIKTVFDPTEAVHVCQAMVPYENAFIDKHLLEYHWLFATDLYSITFTGGAHEPTSGEIITGGTSGATGEIDFITVDAGTWAGTATGTIYIRDITGTWANGETIKQGTDDCATSSSAAALAPTYNYLNKEYVLDMKTWKWFPLNRWYGNFTITNRLQCGAEVVDTSGNYFTYGFTDAGYADRLEYGTTFDTKAITQVLETGEQVLVQNNLLLETSVCRANLIALARNTDTDLTLTHVIDGALTGTDYAVTMSNATKRYANTVTPIFSTPGVFHAFRLTMTTNDETKGLVPIYLAVYFKEERDNI